MKIIKLHLIGPIVIAANAGLVIVNWAMIHQNTSVREKMEQTTVEMEQTTARLKAAVRFYQDACQGETKTKAKF
jgi:flagellar basal body-associated protein FliL